MWFGDAAGISVLLRSSPDAALYPRAGISRPRALLAVAGWTPLHYASAFGEYDIARILFGAQKLPARAERSRPLSASSPRPCSARRPQPPAGALTGPISASSAAENGADIRAWSKDNQTAIDVAADDTMR